MMYCACVLSSYMYCVGVLSRYHDVLRIRETRNSLFHCQRAELDYETFQAKWLYVTDALQRLDKSLSSFDNYLNSDLDREADVALFLQGQDGLSLYGLLDFLELYCPARDRGCENPQRRSFR